MGDLVEGDDLTFDYSSSRTWRWKTTGTAQPLTNWPDEVVISVETCCSGKPFGPAHRTRFRSAERIADSGMNHTITPSPEWRSAP